MAIGALPRRHGVHAGQRETGRGVIELAIGPLDRVVTLLARRGEADVRHRGVRIVEVGLVATDAGRFRDVVVVVDVAIGALPRRYRVRAGQGKFAVEWSKVAGCHAVVVWQVSQVCENFPLHVVRIRRGLEVLQVARNAGVGRQVVVVVDVAIRALSRRNGVRAGQAGSSPSCDRSVAGDQPLVVWQVASLRELPVTWFGLVVP